MDAIVEERKNNGQRVGIYIPSQLGTVMNMHCIMQQHEYKNYYILYGVLAVPTTTTPLLLSDQT